MEEEFDSIKILEVKNYDKNKNQIILSDETKINVNKNRKYPKGKLLMVKGEEILENNLYNKLYEFYQNYREFIESSEKTTKNDQSEEYVQIKKNFNLKIYMNKLNNKETIHNSLKISSIYNEISKVDSYMEEIYDMKIFKATLSDKMVIGLGGASVNETDITLHHTYGIPYIPGQAIKGVLRNYILQEKNLSEIDAMKKEWFRDLFGGVDEEGNSHVGKVIFFDAFPINDFVIEKDIMTCHHQQYYIQNNKYPCDNDKINPIQFFVVKSFLQGEQLEFEVRIAIDKTIVWNQDNKLSDYLKKVFENYGIGAKTAIGYGHFIKWNEGK